MTLVEHHILGVFELSLLGERRCYNADHMNAADITLAKFCEIPKLNRLGKRAAGGVEKICPVLDAQNRQSTYSICVVLVRPDPAALSVSRFLLVSLLHNAYSNRLAGGVLTALVFLERTVMIKEAAQ